MIKDICKDKNEICFVKLRQLLREIVAQKERYFCLRRIYTKTLSRQILTAAFQRLRKNYSVKKNPGILRGKNSFDEENLTELHGETRW